MARVRGSASHVREPQLDASRRPRHAPRVGRPATVRYSPRGALAERFTRRPRPRMAARKAPTTGRTTTPRAVVWRSAERPRACRVEAGKPRSTPKRACFTTWSVAALGCATREVTFYLAVPSSSSSAPLSSGPSASSSPVLRRLVLRPPPGPFCVLRQTRSASLAGLALRPPPSRPEVPIRAREVLGLMVLALTQRGAGRALGSRSPPPPSHPLLPVPLPGSRQYPFWLRRWPVSKFRVGLREPLDHPPVPGLRRTHLETTVGARESVGHWFVIVATFAPVLGPPTSR
jgi:hypothetical protein